MLTIRCVFDDPELEHWHSWAGMCVVLYVNLLRDFTGYLLPQIIDFLVCTLTLAPACTWQHPVAVCTMFRLFCILSHTMLHTLSPLWLLNAPLITPLELHRVLSPICGDCEWTFLEGINNQLHLHILHVQEIYSSQHNNVMQTKSDVCVCRVYFRILIQGGKCVWSEYYW